MTSSTLSDPSKTRETRRAAARAAAASVRFGPAVQMLVSEIKPGDFVESVPSQQGYRGFVMDAVVAEVPVSEAYYTLNTHRGGRRFPVPSVTLRTLVPRWTCPVVPASFTATVRPRITD